MAVADSPKSTTSSCDFVTPMPKSSSSKKPKRKKTPKALKKQKLDSYIGIRALSFHWFCLDTRIKILHTFPKTVSLINLIFLATSPKL